MKVIESDMEIIPTVKKLKSILPVIILLQNIEDKSPTYILEKIQLMALGSAWQSLDPKNLEILRNYLKKWNLEDFTEGG